MPPQTTIPAAGGGDPFVRIFTLLQALRRRWRVWSATALVGLVLGGVFFAARPLHWSATTTLLLRRPTVTAADPTRQMETDVQMADSVVVLDGALRHLTPGSLSSYTVASLTNDVMQITTQGPTATAAVQSADALAASFLGFRAQQQAQEAKVLAGVLQKEIDSLTAKLATLNDQINAAAQQSPAGGGQNALGQLLTSRAQLDGQRASIQQRSTDAADSATVAAQTSRVLDVAHPSRPSKIRTLAVDLAAGLIGGAAAGAGWVVFVAATTERLRRREDVMTALDAPVAVSIASVADRHRFRGRPRVNMKQVRRRLRKPARSDRLMVNHLRRALAESTTAKPALLVVSVDSDWSAAPVVASVAAELRGDGHGILMADFSNQTALGRLLRAKEPVSTVHAGPPASKLWRGSDPPGFGATVDDWLLLNDLAGEADIILVLATLDPAVGAGHLAGLATTAVVVATAGRSTATALRSTAQMVRAAGVLLHSAILVGADRRDETSGLAPRGPHPAGDTRSLQHNR